MAKGLSALQKGILEVLRNQSPQCESQWWRETWRPVDIIAALGRENTASNRVAVSKALSRLIDRGLVDYGRYARATQGMGYRYSLRRR